MRFVSHVLSLIAASTVLLAQTVASANSCALEFAALDSAFPRLAPQAKLSVEQAIDYLAEFEGHFKSVTDDLQNQLSRATLAGATRSQLQSKFEAERLALQGRLTALTDQTLEASDSFIRQDFESSVETLRRASAGFHRHTLIAIRREQGASFSDISENPELISPRLTYQVPVPDSIFGASAAGKLSVRFSEEVVSELIKAPHESHRFMRSLLKGYIGPHAGDGILRITDQHEDLVEIKFVSKGAHRLIGCRRPGGLIEVLKYYEKRNEGAGGSLKRFAKLCE